MQGRKLVSLVRPIPRPNRGGCSKSANRPRGAGAERSGDDDPPASGDLLLSPEIDHFVMAITAGEAMAQYSSALVLDLWDFGEADHVACTCQDYASLCL
jgi:hypothetical protein